MKETLRIVAVLGVLMLLLGAVGVANAAAVTVTDPQNLCQAIRGPGFWKNYRVHLSDATFQALLHATEDYKGMTPAQAVRILGNNPDKYHKFLLSAELNAVYNGQNTRPGISPLLGNATYTARSDARSPLNRMTVKQILHQAFRTSAAKAGADLLAAVKYLGNGGKKDKINACLVR